MQSYAQLLVICHPQEVPQLVRLHRELPRVELGAFDAACALCRPYAILQEATTCTGAHATEVHMCKTFKRASAGDRSAKCLAGHVDCHIYSALVCKTLEAFERTIAARELRKCLETHDSFPRDLWSSRTATAANSSKPSVLSEARSASLILRSCP